MKKLLLILLCVIIFAGCQSYTVITYRVIDVLENPIGTKIGQVDQTKGGILEAARNGNITRISTVTKQNTDKYVVHAWMAIFGMEPMVINTMHLEEIIVTGE